jgi:proteasome alpha subunit
VLAAMKDKVTGPPLSLKAALGFCVSALEQTANQKLSPEGLEVAVLERARTGRKFRRLMPVEVQQLLTA